MSATDTVCGLFVAPGAVTEILPICGPKAKPAGFTDTMKPLGVSERAIHGAFGVAVKERVPPLALETLMACGGVNEA